MRVITRRKVSTNTFIITVFVISLHAMWNCFFLVTAYEYYSERYKLDGVPCGYCIIINNDDCRSTSVHFDPTENLSFRSREDITKTAIQNLFKEKLGFHVETFVSLSIYAIRQLLEAIRNVDHTNLSCFALIIFSRGKTNDIYGANNSILSVNDIVDNFSDTKCESLVRKPKLFLFQTIIENDHIEKVPLESIHSPSDSFLILVTPAAGHADFSKISTIIQALEAGCRTDSISTIFESIEKSNSDTCIIKDNLEYQFFFCNVEFK